MKFVLVFPFLGPDLFSSIGTSSLWRSRQQIPMCIFTNRYEHTTEVWTASSCVRFNINLHASTSSNRIQGSSSYCTIDIGERHLWIPCVLCTSLLNVGEEPDMVRSTRGNYVYKYFMGLNAFVLDMPCGLFALPYLPCLCVKGIKT